jgi:putative SOS response-associated peptidase YedK
MCGRYVLRDKPAIERLVATVCEPGTAEIPVRFNIAPAQMLPVVAAIDSQAAALVPMRWGFVPSWEKSEKPRIAPINARSEAILTKFMFRQAVQKRRALVPADGFFEWQRANLNPTAKVPHFIGLRDGQPFFFAGIYEQATEIRPPTYAILTTQPNSLVATIHDRMPVILAPAAARRWLKDGDLTADELVHLCVPYPAKAMQAYPVSSLVNNPANDRQECVAAVRT